MKLYLAHPFGSRKKIREWELKVEAETGVELINPFYDATRQDVEEIDSGRADRYEKLVPTTLVERDLKLINKSQGIVAIVDGALSYGTIMEIVYASRFFHKPVYMVVSNGHYKHPWLQYHATEMFESLKEMRKWLKKKAPADE